MPKVIENLRESILASAKRELLESGYDNLNIRAVARSCGIAVGTVYNYFPSKEMLAASVIAGDWGAELGRMRALCAGARGLNEALRALYGGVSDFCAGYRSVWSSYTFSRGAHSEYGARRGMLVRQLAACIAPALERFVKGGEAGLDVFIAENVLVCAAGSEMTFDSFLRITRRLLG